MATAVFSEVSRTAPVLSRKAQAYADFTEGSRGESGDGGLTIHRTTPSHHGRTLLTLGHAAEHLKNSRRYSMETFDRGAEAEAVHILMSLSRSVFEEYAEERMLNRLFEQWLVEPAVRLLE
jgi:hypothetical protein